MPIDIAAIREKLAKAIARFEYAFGFVSAVDRLAEQNAAIAELRDLEAMLAKEGDD